MRQRSLCPSCRHQVVVMRRGELVFCTREQKLTHPLRQALRIRERSPGRGSADLSAQGGQGIAHLVCQRSEPARDADPQAVKECQRRKAACRPGEPCISRKG